MEETACVEKVKQSIYIRSSITSEEWEDKPGTTNPVESIKCQSITQNVKSISLRVDHWLNTCIYMEDRRNAIMQVATGANITITYNTREKKNLQTSKTLRKAIIIAWKHSQQYSYSKKAIGAHASVEFYNDPEHKSTRWYKGTVIAHNKQGYLINFNEYGPVFLIRSYGAPNGAGRCSLAQ